MPTGGPDDLLPPQFKRPIDKAEEALNNAGVDRLLEDVQKLGEEIRGVNDEVRVTSETGGSKGTKPCQLAFAAPEGLKALGEVYGFGATKYDPTNYRKGYAWSLSLHAMLRHILAFMAGEDFDPESGLPHMAHASWHGLTLVQYMKDHPELDDRYKA